MPADNGSVTPRVAAAATAASMALPPLRSTASPTPVAVASTVAIAPPDPVAVGTAGAFVGEATGVAGWAALGPTRSVPTTIRARNGLRTGASGGLMPFAWLLPTLSRPTPPREVTRGPRRAAIHTRK